MVRTPSDVTRSPSKVIRAPECPECGIKTSRVLLAGKQAICINIKCPVTKFTVQDFGKEDHKKFKPNKENKSYNNSGRRSGSRNEKK